MAELELRVHRSLFRGCEDAVDVVLTWYVLNDPRGIVTYANYPEPAAECAASERMDTYSKE